MNSVETNRAIHKRLQELADGFVPDWDEDNSEEKYYLWDKEGLWGLTFSNPQPNTVYFRKPTENLQQLVDARFGEGALEQYLQGGVL